MNDPIEPFRVILSDPQRPLPQTASARFVFIRAELHRSGRFCYRLNHGAFARLATYSLDDVRAAAAHWALPVKEVGPPEAFGRKPRSAMPSEQALCEYVDLHARREAGPMVDFAARYPVDAPILFKATPFLNWQQAIARDGGPRP
jgi:hypothetical protein